MNVEQQEKFSQKSSMNIESSCLPMSDLALRPLIWTTLLSALLHLK